MQPSPIQSLEAVLFITGEPVRLKDLAKTLSVDAKALDELLHVLEERYAQDAESAFFLVRTESAVRLTTKPGLQPLLEDLSKQSLQSELSRAALEVLAIVAYRAPISRSEIEAIRGVNCSFTLRNLLLRELIERKGNPNDLRGYLYSPSSRFLEHLGLASIHELPDFETLSRDERAEHVIQEALQNENTAE